MSRDYIYIKVSDGRRLRYDYETGLTCLETWSVNSRGGPAFWNTKPLCGHDEGIIELSDALKVLGEQLEKEGLE